MKPILFNTEMVQAILDGRKTVTRRIVKPQLMEFQENKTAPWDNIKHCRDNVFEFKCRNFTSFHSAQYQVGDILYVRETWLEADDGLHYKADETPTSKEIRIAYGYKWKPSIHMPKSAARIFLKVTDVRVERLCNMLTIDFLKEGIELYKSDGRTEKGEIEIEYEFEDLWNSTIKKQDLEKYGWDANPWVWVIEFEPLKGGLA